MSTHYEIFIRSRAEHVEPEEIAWDVGRSTGAHMELLRSGPEEEWGGRADCAVVELFVDHQFEDDYKDDDDGLDFSTHPYMVRFRDFQGSLERELETMHSAYRSLARNGNYDLFATLDLQVRADPERLT